MANQTSFKNKINAVVYDYKVTHISLFSRPRITNFFKHKRLAFVLKGALYLNARFFMCAILSYEISCNLL